MLWKDDDISLPYNRELAVNHLLAMERKFKSNHEFAKLYKEQVEEYINLGHARKLSHKGKSQNNNIVNPNKPGKVRIVFGAAAKFKNTSLNENLLTGPDLLNNLVTVLCHFRLGKYAVIADIEKTFNQVKAKPEDQNALRILFSSINKKINVHSKNIKIRKT